MSSFKVTLAYDGTDFVGWQRQASGTSIQGLLEDALRDLDQTRRRRGRRGSYRCRRPRARSGRQLHAQPFDSTVTELRPRRERTPPRQRAGRRRRRGRSATFHARFDATRKVYRYRIWNGDVLSPFERAYAWHVPGAARCRRHAGGRDACRGPARFRGVPGGRQRDAIQRARGVFVGRPPSSRDAPAASGRRDRWRWAARRIRGDGERLPPPHGPEHRRFPRGDRARTPAGRVDDDDHRGTRSDALRARPHRRTGSCWWRWSMPGVLLRLSDKSFYNHRLVNRRRFLDLIGSLAGLCVERRLFTGCKDA